MTQFFPPPNQGGSLIEHTMSSQYMADHLPRKAQVLPSLRRQRFETELEKAIPVDHVDPRVIVVVCVNDRPRSLPFRDDHAGGHCKEPDVVVSQLHPVTVLKFLFVHFCLLPFAVRVVAVEPGRHSIQKSAHHPANTSSDHIPYPFQSYGLVDEDHHVADHLPNQPLIEPEFFEVGEL